MPAPVPRAVRYFVASADAEQWLRRRHDREFSWVDAASFATMRERRTTQALAFDGDFAAAGSTELRT